MMKQIPLKDSVGKRIKSVHDEYCAGQFVIVFEDKTFAVTREAISYDEPVFNATLCFDSQLVEMGFSEDEIKDAKAEAKARMKAERLERIERLKKEIEDI